MEKERKKNALIGTVEVEGKLWKRNERKNEILKVRRMNNKKKHFKERKSRSEDWFRWTNENYRLNNGRKSKKKKLINYRKQISLYINGEKKEIESKVKEVAN